MWSQITGEEMALKPNLNLVNICAEGLWCQDFTCHIVYSFPMKETTCVISHLLKEITEVIAQNRTKKQARKNL